MTASSQGARTLFASFTAALLAASLPGQQFPEGTQHQVVALPTTATTVLVRTNGDVVFFDGQSLWWQPPGPNAKLLLRLPAPAFGSFVIETDAGHLLFGESSTGGLWHVPLAGPSPTTPLCTLGFNYDAVMLDANRALVSAKTGGFASPQNNLFVVDLTTGIPWLLVSIPGPSGPVALAKNGDVYYAIASSLFPTPPGLASIVRFAGLQVLQAIQQRRRLTMADMHVVATGLDAAADLCFDDDGDLFFVDWMNNTVGELNDAASAAPWLGTPLASFGPLPGPASLHFEPATGAAAGVFEPFQPDGGKLHVHETDYFSTSSVRTIRSARADLAITTPSPVPSGTFSLQVTNGPAGGFGFVGIALVSAGGSGAGFAMPGFEQPLVWNLASATPILWPIALGPQGTATLAIPNPGFSPAITATAQAAFVSSTGVLGSTNAPTFLLGP